MADATCTSYRCEEKHDTLTRLNAILDAFWANLDSREQQTTAHAYLRSKKTTRSCRRRGVPQPKGAPRWHRRKRPLPSARKHTQRNRATELCCRELQTLHIPSLKQASPCSRRKKRYSSLPQIRTPPKKIQRFLMDAATSYTLYADLRCDGQAGRTKDIGRDSRDLPTKGIE
ncbi:Hypothetical predicted protein [Pelobates cultripes]|uniref:Uncharacterized protein n=1 Tax=Pelobates cultripes TaxID=61616 RepID=A0AAD1WQB0_PELCU|nr:Hypothetical predicted protein [Pelobates cultripes]